MFANDLLAYLLRTKDFRVRMISAIFPRQCIFYINTDTTLYDVLCILDKCKAHLIK